MLISAIMPTRARGHLIWAAIRSFLAQDYADRELVILDDDDAPSLVPPLLIGLESKIRYFSGPRWTIGKKLEWLSEKARGEVIIRFDSDDWSAPDRISTQVARLQETGKGLTGYHSLLFWDQVNSQGYRWQGRAPYCCGTSMCYTKNWWNSHHWPEYSVVGGQRRETETDNVLVRQAIQDGSIDSIEGGQYCVARAHGANSSTAQRIAQVGWPKVPASEFPAAFFEAMQIGKAA